MPNMFAQRTVVWDILLLNTLHNSGPTNLDLKVLKARFEKIQFNACPCLGELGLIECRIINLQRSFNHARHRE